MVLGNRRPNTYQAAVCQQLNVGGDALENRRIGELLGDALPIAPVVDASPGSRKIVLVVGVLDVSEELASLAHRGEASSEKISSGAHLRRVDVRLRKHSTSKHGRDLESIDAVILRLASVNRFHVESVTENEVDAFPCAEVREPAPSENAFHSLACPRSWGYAGGGLYAHHADGADVASSGQQGISQDHQSLRWVRWFVQGWPRQSTAVFARQ